MAMLNNQWTKKGTRHGSGQPRRFDLLAGGSRTKAGIVGTHRGPGALAAAGL